MTEEKKEVYEIKKSCVKKFLLIVAASFTGCLLAMLLLGLLAKPKFPPCGCPYGKMMPPPPMGQMQPCQPPLGGENFRRHPENQLPTTVHKPGNKSFHQDFGKRPTAPERPAAQTPTPIKDAQRPATHGI